MSSKYFFSHVLVYKMSHEPGIAFISPTPCITLSSSSQVCNEYFLTTLCLMYKGCQVNMQTDLIYRQLWKINWNDLYYFLTLSPSITTHFPHLRTSVFWKCIILLAGLCCTRELFHESSLMDSWPSYKCLHHSNTDKCATICSPNTHDSQQWIYMDFEPSVNTHFITIHCSCIGVSWSDNILNNKVCKNSKSHHQESDTGCSLSNSYRTW